ncbi:MAG: hypothetical protein N2606_01975 [Candidatus Omnitrophica bacterium]|nr:hypothetical protein [Candidatus Omnitrophota bacterium]
MDQEKDNIHPIELIKESFVLWSRYFWSLTGIYLIILPIVLLNIFFSLQKNSNWLFILMQTVLFFVGLIVIIWVQIALIVTVLNLTKEKVISIGEVLRETRIHFWRYLGTTFLISLFLVLFVFLLSMGMGFIYYFLSQNSSLWVNVLVLLAMTGIFVSFLVFYGIRWSVSNIACVAENLSPLAAIKRSYQLVSKKVNSVIGVWVLLFCFIFLLGIMQTIFVLRSGGFVRGAVNDILQFLIGMISLQLWIVISVKLFTALHSENNRKLNEQTTEAQEVV